MDALVQDFNTALDETAGSNSSERSITSRRKVREYIPILYRTTVSASVIDADSAYNFNKETDLGEVLTPADKW